MPILPWPGLLSNALTLVDAAARLWSGTRKGGSKAADAQVAEKLSSQAQGLSALEARALSLEGRTSDLESEALSSSQLLQSLAQQDYQMARALEVLRRRTRILAWTCGVIATATLGTILWMALH